MKRIKWMALWLLPLVLWGCKSDPLEQTGWIIPQEEVFDGGPGRDGIPSIDNPEFDDVAGAPSTLAGPNLVVGFKYGSEIKAYPHYILDWHEITNDQVSGLDVSINYCPLTGTAMAWNRNIQGDVTTFGVSGLLYNTNIIPYDRKTSSNWSQMLMQAVSGDLSGTDADMYQVVETTWDTWKTMYPNTRVMNENTEKNRSYGVYPYGSYRTDHSRVLFPLTRTDDRIPNKERVLGVRVNEKMKAYQFKHFQDSTHVYNDEFEGERLVVAGNAISNYMIVFQSTLSDGTQPNFYPVQDQLPVIMRDAEGSTWDIFGEAVSGPRKGERLSYQPSVIGYWLAFPAFYENVEIF